MKAFVKAVGIFAAIIGFTALFYWIGDGSMLLGFLYVLLGIMILFMLLLLIFWIKWSASPEGQAAAKKKYEEKRRQEEFAKQIAEERMRAEAQARREGYASLQEKQEIEEILAMRKYYSDRWQRWQEEDRKLMEMDRDMTEEEIRAFDEANLRELDVDVFPYYPRYK